MSAMFPNRLEFARQLGITDLVRIEVRNAHTRSVFRLECTNIMKERSPAVEVFQIFSDMMGEKDVPGVATIHHPLRHVDACTSHVGAFVYVHHATNGATVNAHANLQMGIALKRTADLYRTLHRLLRTLVKHQRHAVAGGDL